MGFATRDHHGPVMSKKQAFLFPFQGRGQVEYSHTDTVDGDMDRDREEACVKQLSFFFRKDVKQLSKESH